MSKTGIETVAFGIVCNLALFFVKLYIGISTGSLSVYCDSINNLGDTMACLIALTGFLLIIRLDEKRGGRVQALASFVIGLILAITGAFFAYNGMERFMYPVPIDYQKRYAVLISVTIVVKLVMALVYHRANKKSPSPVFKTLIADSWLDTAITLSTLLGLTLAVKINFAIDSVIAVAIGIAVAVEAVKTTIEQAKYLIND